MKERMKRSPTREARIRDEIIVDAHAGSETVTVLAMAPEAECEHEMFVRIQWQGRSFGVPLIQLKGKKADVRARQAIEDWHYWVGQGYMF
jgi:hypothetical protein